MQTLTNPNHCLNKSGEGIPYQEGERQLQLEHGLGCVTKANVDSVQYVVRDPFAARNKHFATGLNTQSLFCSLNKKLERDSYLLALFLLLTMSELMSL